MGLLFREVIGCRGLGFVLVVGVDLVRGGCVVVVWTRRGWLFVGWKRVKFFIVISFFGGVFI